jgi:hypothetical protein
MSTNFTNDLILKFLDKNLKDKPFEVYEDFEYHVGGLNSGGKIIHILKGCPTDFASIPRFFHRIINPIGPWGKAAVVHDHLCDESPHSCSSKEAADIFLEAMEVLKVPKTKRRLMHRGVVWFGPKFEKGDL